MLYLAIDQHRKQLTVNLRNEQGDVLVKRQVSTEWPRVRSFLEEVREMSVPEGGFVAILEVCGFNDWLLKLLTEYGCRETILIQPEKRSKKTTDRRDAYRFFNDAQYYRGLEMAGKALADIGDPAAPAIIEEAKEYREDIVRAHRSMQAKSPVVPLKNGTWVPANPSLFGCYGNVEDFMPTVFDCATECYNTEVGSHHLVASGVLDPACKDADWMIDYLEDVQFLRAWRPGEIGKIDAFDWGGFGKTQPYYCRIAEIHALRDDVKPFIRSYFNTIPALVVGENLSFWEGWTNCVPGNAWNKTHETGWFLCQTQTMFATERGDELWLAPFVTNHWLKDGQKVAIRNAPTRFGNVSYTITSKVAEGEIDAVVQLPAGCTARKIVLRLRHPDGKPIQSVIVQGKPHKDFDLKKETITFEPFGQSVTIRAEY